MPDAVVKPSTDLTTLTASQLVAAVTSQQITCEAITRACLERIAAREPAVQAWHYLDPEFALHQAIELDRSGARGALAGVPFGVKDIIDTADMPTEYGTPIHAGHRPGKDAACVALARKAGAVLFGKTVTTEFANFFPGKTRNPWDPARTPGGSSSGSGAAVGDRMVPLAIGTQTSASTIRPASFCGAVGYCATYNHFRRAGVMEAAGSLDSLGLFARSVDDIALFRDVQLGVAHVPLAELPAPPRIGLCRTHLWSQVERNTQRMIEDTAQALARAGAQVVDLELPVDFERLIEAQRWISAFEFARNLAWEIEHHYEQISAKLRSGRIQDGLDCSFERYRAACDVAQDCRSRFAAEIGNCDVLLTAPVTGEAPLGLESTGNASLCILWTTLHVPAITLPVLRGPSGLPVGVQLIGRHHQDRGLLAAARWAMRVLE